MLLRRNKWAGLIQTTISVVHNCKLLGTSLSLPQKWIEFVMKQCL